MKYKDFLIKFVRDHVEVYKDDLFVFSEDTASDAIKLIELEYI